MRPQEFLHRRLPWLADPFTFEDLPDGQGDDLQVQPKRQVIHVPHIQIELLLPGERVAAVHLRPASDAGAHFMARKLLTYNFPN